MFIKAFINEQGRFIIETSVFRINAGYLVQNLIDLMDKPHIVVTFDGMPSYLSGRISDGNTTLMFHQQDDGAFFWSKCYPEAQNPSPASANSNAPNNQQ